MNRAREWLQDGWRESLPEEEFNKFLIYAGILCALSQKQLLEILQIGDEELDEKSRAELCVELIPEAMQGLDRIGRGAHESGVARPTSMPPRLH